MALPAILGMASRAGALGSRAVVATRLNKIAASPITQAFAKASGANKIPALDSVASYISKIGRPTKPDPSEKSSDKNRNKSRDDAAKNEQRQEKAKRDSERKSDDGNGLLRIIAKDTVRVRDAVEKLVKGGLGEESKGGGLMGLLGGLTTALGSLGPLMRGLPAMLKGLPAILKGGGGLLKTAATAAKTIPGIGARVLKMGAGAGAAAALGGGAVTALKGAARDPVTGRFISRAALAAREAASAAPKGIVGKGLGLAGAAAGAIGKIAGKGGGMMGKGIAKAAGKSLVKKIPIIGALAGIGFGISRAMAGDWTGAGLEVASGLAGTVPGPGTAASLGLDAALIARDIHNNRAGRGGMGGGGGTGEIPKPTGVGVAPTARVNAAPANSSVANRTAAHGTSSLRSMDATLREMLKMMSDKSLGIYTTTSDPTVSRLTQGGRADFSNVTASVNRGSVSPTVDSGYVNVPTTGVGGTQSGASLNAGRRAAGGGKFNGFGSDIDGYISEAAKKYGMSEDVLRGFVKMEAGWTGKASPTGALGVGQFTQGTWNSLAKTPEGRELGMGNVTGDMIRASQAGRPMANDPRADKRLNTLATALLAKQNSRQFLGKDVSQASGEELYMLHNLGPEYTRQALSGNLTAKGREAIDVNGGRGMSGQDFLAYQKGRFQSHYAAANSGLAGVSSSTMTASGGSVAAGVRETAAARAASAKAPVIVSAPTTVNPPAKQQGRPHGGSGSRSPVVVRNGDSPVRANVNSLIRTI